MIAVRILRLAMGVLLVGVAATLIWLAPDGWVLRSAFVKSTTYPYASVLGTNVGGQDKGALAKTLAKLQTSFSAKVFAVNSGTQRWAFSPQQLGLRLDLGATGQRLWALNNEPLGDKLRMYLARKNGRTAIEPVVLLDHKQCEQSLKPVVAINRPATDALLYYAEQIKIKPDAPGVSFNAGSTCQAIVKAVEENEFASAAATDPIPARLTYADYAAQLNTIKGMAGRALTFHYGNYSKKLNPQTLLTYVVLSKAAGKPTKAAWDNAKLDSVVADMATHVDTYTAPRISSCQVLVSYGGVRLDRKATKAVIVAQNASKPTDYTLRTYTVQAVVDARSNLNGGTKGTVYLTYDDGMTYAGQIMDTAACYGIHVTFFEVGSRADSEAALLKRAISEGHAVQSYGYIHAIYDYGTGHSYSWQVDDIKKSITVLQAITGRRPTYFRPPGGNHTQDTYKAAAANGIQLILWDLSSIDTADISSAQICANVVNGAGPGYVVLMHSTHIITANALPCIAEGLAARGFNMKALW